MLKNSLKLSLITLLLVACGKEQDAGLTDVVLTRADEALAKLGAVSEEVRVQAPRNFTQEQNNLNTVKIVWGRSTGAACTEWNLFFGSSGETPMNFVSGLKAESVREDNMAAASSYVSASGATVSRIGVGAVTVTRSAFDGVMVTLPAGKKVEIPKLTAKLCSGQSISIPAQVREFHPGQQSTASFDLGNNLQIKMERVGPAALEQPNVGNFTLSNLPAKIERNSTVYVEWSVAAGVESYRMVIPNQSGACSTGRVPYTNITIQKMAFPSDYPAGRYKVCVFAKGTNGVERPATNNGLEIELAELPAAGAFSISTLPTSFIAGSRSLEAGWNIAANTQSYRVLFAPSQACNAGSTYPNLSGLSMLFPSAIVNTPGDTYLCVFAKGRNGAERAASNNGVLIRVLGRPAGAFSILTQSFEIFRNQQASVVWSQAVNARSYRVLLATSQSCSAGTVVQTAVTTAGSALPTSLAAGDHFMCLFARGEDGVERAAANNGILMRLKEPLAAAAFTISTAPSEFIFASRTLSPSWSGAANAVSYRVLIANSQSCVTGSVNVPVVNALTINIANTLPIGNHYICVFAKGQNGVDLAASNNGVLVRVMPRPLGAFSITTAPSTFIRNRPANVFWSAAANVVSYRVMLASGQNCASGTTLFAATPAIGAVFPTAGPAGSSYLCLFAKGDDGVERPATNNGVLMTLAEPAAAGPFSISTAPSEFVVGSRNLAPSWTAASGTDSYRVLIANSASCATGNISFPVVNALSINISNSLPIGSHYICLFAKGQNGVERAASNNGVLAKVTGQPVGAFSITTPASTFIRNQARNFSWSAAANAVSYRALIANASTCTQGNLAYTNVTALGLSFPVGSAAGQYYLCLFAKGQDGVERAASNNGIRIVLEEPAPAGAFSLTSYPTQLVAGSAASPIQWSVSTKAVSYRILFATSSACNSGTNYSNVTGNTLSIPSGPISVPGSVFFCAFATGTDGVERAATNNGARLQVLFKPAGAFSITTPVTEVARNGSLNMFWTASANSSSYRILIGNSAQCVAGIPFRSGLTSIGHFFPTGSAVGKHYICIYAKGEDGVERAASNNGVMVTIK